MSPKICPKCKTILKVQETRSVGEFIVRRRICPVCKALYFTRESVISPEMGNVYLTQWHYQNRRIEK